MSDLRTALEGAINEAEIAEKTDETSSVEAKSTEAVAPVETDVAAASDVSQDEPVQADDGAEKAAEPAPKDAPEPAAASPKDEAVPAVKQSRIDRAPASWKKEAKGEWANIPLHVRQEVHKREMEVQKVLQETAPVRQFAEQFQQVIAPYQARMQSLGAAPLQAVQNLLVADYQLSSAPKGQRAALMAKFIKDYDIDIVALDEALAGAAPSQEQGADVSALVQEQIQQALAPLMQREQQQRQQAQEKINHTVESMALDPKYPYFDEVRYDMADLIDSRAKRGIDLSLEEAYAMATRMNPEVYAETQRQNTVQSATQQHQQAQRAKNAASSVTGVPAAGGTSGFVGNGDLRSSIEAAFGGARL